MDPTKPSSTDIYVTRNSGVFIVAPASDQAREWLNSNVKVEDHNKLGENLAIEADRIDDLVEKAQKAGLNVRR
jgi:hypothetical protein